MMRTIYVKDYGILPGDRRENGFYLRNLLEELEGQEEIELVFSDGEYHFYPDVASETVLFIPNHDEDGLHKAAFHLKGIRKLRFQGNHAHFQFHTELLPFLLQECEDITIQDLAVDYQRPGYSQGVIRECGSRYKIIEVDQERFPCFIRGGRLYFTGENYCHELVRWMELDKEQEKPVFGLTDRTFNLHDAGEAAVWRELQPGILRVDLNARENPFEEASKPGDYLILRHHPRNNPGFYLENCRNIRLKGIDIYHATAMGVIAQRTEDICLEQVQIRRHPLRHDVFTTEGDGFHFVSCRGQIQIRECLIENQLDDPINIHGIYGRIRKILPDRSFLTELVHEQQKGSQLLKEGERFRFVDARTMLPVGETKAVQVKRLNRDVILVTAEALPEDLQEGWVIENLDWIPDVLVENCIMRNNRARGILPTSAGNVRIQNNLFQVPGAGVLIEGDCNGYFESGAVQHIRIEGNTFDCCAYVPAWGYAPIQISPHAPEYVEGRAYHGLVEVCGNTFRCADDRLLWAKNTEKIIWKNNKTERIESRASCLGDAFVLEHILDEEIDERI